ncbi:hypothetical protein RJ40_07820 [Methanofollis aquaemaris]|uniref:Uncharacterized protein n=1 Tax=Methanofollis aquaemaris TaxID=126734 RepID=A0A8A3S577_9EURY|nr:hypothetical protein [Methanofollis aquaemaris]QSZ67417.1 hypothetical protein RJ40_07820 [Methanofollis aquaemaris]
MVPMKWRALLWMLVLVCLLTPSVASEDEHVETVEIFIEYDPVVFHEEPPENFIIITDVAASNDALIDSYPSLSYIDYAYRVVPVEEVVLSSSEVTITMAGDSGDMVIIRDDAPEVAVETGIVFSSASGMTETVPIYNLVNREGTSRSSAPVYYAQEVPEGTRHHWVDLDWGESEQDLSLSVWHPSGLLGTFRDIDDGKKNGRIFLRISDQDGVEGGTWYYRVSGPRIPVAHNYSFRTYVG